MSHSQPSVSSSTQPAQSSNFASPAASHQTAQKRASYFLVDPQRVGEIAQHQVQDKFKAIRLGADHMQAYIAQCAGVNGRLAELGRISTHGPNAVADRTTLSIRHAQHVLDHLVAAGFLESCGDIEHPSLPKLVKPTFKVDPRHPGTLAVAQAFLKNGSDSKRARRGSLRHLMQYADDAPGIPMALARMDALQLYLSLLTVQDFERCAGVDPALVGSLCQRHPQSPLNRVPLPPQCFGFELMSFHDPQTLEVHEGFAQQVMSYLPSTAEMAPEVDRCHHAFKNLKRSDLIYDAYVLWDSDPTQSQSGEPNPCPLAFDSSIIGTMHVGRQRDKNVEDHLADTMEKFVEHMVIESLTGYDPKSWRVHEMGVPEIRAVLLEHQAATAHLVRQIRVRHWAYDSNNLGALQIDRERVQAGVSRLLQLRKQILDRIYPEATT